jgi:hypothetical protein
LALAVALCAAGAASAQTNGKDDKMNSMGSMGSSMKSMSGMMGMSETFKIHAQNGSGESGMATLTQAGDTLKVKLAIKGGSGDQPAHIHKGTCAKLDPKPAYPLTTVMDGTSSTTLKDVKLSSLTSGTYAINVHKSTTDLKDYVACGNLTIASSK